LRALILAAGTLLAGLACAGTDGVVISQVYGGNGNVYARDYVELFNAGSSTVAIDGWSVQYASASGTGQFAANGVAVLSGSLAPGQFYLVALASGGAGAALPAADASGSTNLSSSSGKVALVRSSTGLACNGGSTACSAAQLALIADLVGYGSANFFEGSAAAPGLGSSTALFRAAGGCTDSGVNGTDFSSGTPAPPMDVCVAHSQGGMGYMLEQSFTNVLKKRGCNAKVAAVLTEVEVDADDPAFSNPTKPVGKFFSESEAGQMTAETGWIFKEDSGRGWRRVVPSPAPKQILDLAAIEALLAADIIPLAAGGGGIPDIRDADGCHHGVPAVIDKDLTSAMLAAQTGAQTFVMLTGVEKVMIDFGKPTARAIDRMTVSEARRHMADGQFPPGSMGPKIEAALNYLAVCDGTVVITALEHAFDALGGQAGTRIVRDA
jgi:carbamate kinase